MTTEEKAKAYDKALKRIRQFYLDYDNISNLIDVKRELESIFPQLHESEDERTRRQLIDFISNIKAISESGRTSWAVRKEDAEMCNAFLAYLEKQNDASKAIEAVDRIDKYIDEHVANAHDMKDSNPDKKYYRGWDDALCEMAGILQDVYSNEKQKESLRDFIDDFPYSDEQKEPKPTATINGEPIPTKNQSVDIPLTEWNYDNRVQYDNVKSGIEAFASTYSFNIESKLFPQLTKEQQQLWREEIEQAVIAGGEDGIELASDSRYKENRTIEWSEEDEKKRNGLIKGLEDRMGFGWAKDPFSREEYIAWLKSLRPKPHWKPSEEQMEALEIAERWYSDNMGCNLDLVSLCEQLKKLM